MSESSDVPYGRYEEAFKAIHSALSQIAAPPSGKRITKFAFLWNSDKTLAALEAFDGDALLFTLTFSWNSDGTLKEVGRSDA
jgi:hypothetical protein